MRLTVRIGDEQRVLPLEGVELRLGRGSDNDLILPDFSVSRQHAILRHEGDAWYVYDLDSTNGVLVNEVPVSRSALHVGDSLRVGIFDLEVEGADSGRAVEAIPNATIVRSFKDFQIEFGLAAPTEAHQQPSEAGTQSRRYLSHLTRLARDLIRSDSVSDVLTKVMDSAFEALPVDRGFILLGEADQAICELSRISDRVEIRPRGDVPVSKTILRTVMEQQVALLTLDALGDQRLVGGESIRIHGIRAAMCAPLWSEDRISGFIQLDSPFQTGSFSDDHLDFLIALANYAAIGVERVRERRVRGRLERYHSPAIIEQVLRDVEVSDEVVGMRKAEVTVLFADLVDFTPYSEAASPEEVAELLKGYCNRAVGEVFRHGGTLDKFIGDCVMAFFGAPVDQPDHALRAVEAALGIQRAVAEWNVERSACGQPEVRCRVALNSGPVVVGDVGSDTRVDYTVLGNTVNVAARLEANVGQAGAVVVGEATRLLVGDRFAVEPMGEFSLKGLQQKVNAYRVLDGAS